MNSDLVLNFPIFVHLVLTYICNSRCPMCPYVGNEGLREKKSKEMGSFMSMEVFCKIIDECSENNGFVRITGGGEPLLHPRFLELMKYVREKNRNGENVRTGIITNGSFLYRDMAIGLLESNTVIEASVDADCKDTYEKIRVGLDWKRLVENVKNLIRLRRELGSHSKIIVSVVNQKGVDIDKVKKFWEETIGVDYVIIRKFLTWNVISDELSADKKPLLASSAVHKSANGLCPYLFERITIDLDGTMRLCNEDILGKTNFGNIKNDSIKEIWNGNRLKEYRKNMLEGKWDKLELCNGCNDRLYRSWDWDYKRVLREIGK